jgi:hypothetical protein
MDTFTVGRISSCRKHKPTPKCTGRFYSWCKKLIKRFDFPLDKVINTFYLISRGTILQFCPKVRQRIKNIFKVFF